jgi:hypothetical protein
MQSWPGGKPDLHETDKESFCRSVELNANKRQPSGPSLVSYGHRMAISSITFAPVGNRLASASSARRNGKLTDNSDCSVDHREYLRFAKSENLGKYLQTCLLSPFERSGLVLQYIVNEFGRRLDYTVENGLYQGQSLPRAYLLSVEAFGPWSPRREVSKIA